MNGICARYIVEHEGEGHVKSIFKPILKKEDKSIKWSEWIMYTRVQILEGWIERIYLKQLVSLRWMSYYPSKIILQEIKDCSGARLKGLMIELNIVGITAEVNSTNPLKLKWWNTFVVGEWDEILMMSFVVIKLIWGVLKTNNNQENRLEKNGGEFGPNNEDDWSLSSER